LYNEFLIICKISKNLSRKKSPCSNALSTNTAATARIRWYYFLKVVLLLFKKRKQLSQKLWLGEDQCRDIWRKIGREMGRKNLRKGKDFTFFLSFLSTFFTSKYTCMYSLFEKPWNDYSSNLSCASGVSK